MPTPLLVVQEQSDSGHATHDAWPGPYIDLTLAPHGHATPAKARPSSDATTGPTLIPDEIAWRRLPRHTDNAPHSAFAPMRFSRWRDASENGGEYQCLTEASLYTVGIALQPTDAVVTVDGRR